VTTCFIFTKHFDDEQCLCLRLDENGQVDAPLAVRSMNELRLLQNNARTIVVLPTESSSLHEIELPWLGERKARAAIPYALEEQLAQDVLTLHFAFDRKHYQNHHYLVGVTDKQLLVDLIAKFDALNLRFDLLTLDWFALNEGEACVTEYGLLIHDNLFKGALRGELADLYLSNIQRNAQLFAFNDSIPLLQKLNVISIDNLSSVWVAQRLLQSNMMNLCQGELQHDTRQQSSKQWYWVSGMMASLLVVSIFLFKGIYLHSLNTHITDIDKKIAVIFREFFPEAQQVTSPKFRISQLLKSGSVTSDTSSLSIMLDKLAHAVSGSQMTINQFHFQNQVLSVMLVSNDFAALEALQQRLQQAQVKVKQDQASSQEKQVMATLELSL
jgi:general secretion pathway protein L